MKLAYIAGPFRAANAWLVEQNIRRAEELGFKVAGAGAFPIVPHTNCRFWNGTQTDEFWLEGTMEAMRRCDAVVFTDDYERSSGAVGEFAEAQRLGIPCFSGVDGFEAFERWVKQPYRNKPT